MNKITTTIIFLLISSYNLISQNQLADSLKIHYTFNNNSNDQSGNNNHGLIVGGSYTTDRHGNENSACLLVGDGDWVEFPNVQNLWEGNWTYSLWFKLDLLPSTLSDAFLLTYKDIAYGEDVHLFVDDQDNQIKLFFSNTFDKISSNVAVNSDTWYFVAMVSSPNENKLYVNGELKATTTQNYTTQYSNNKLIISSNYSADNLKGRIFGAIDDTRLYNVSLNDSDIMSLYEMEETLSTSDNNINLNKEITTVFPNPSHGKVYIKSNKLIKTVYIFDLTGKKVDEVNMLNREKVEISNLSKGIYVLKLEKNNGVLVNKKLIIK